MLPWRDNVRGWVRVVLPCMSVKNEDGVQQQQQANSFYAALARTATRSLALYFSRPVRLFRPSKGTPGHVILRIPLNDLLSQFLGGIHCVDSQIAMAGLSRLSTSRGS